ncbi:MAG TPA: ATP-dependent DNA helicase, partial [Mesotoga sp.]|nr:ATP-dependent DNA helicase [Mesotoga sp.]
RISQNSPFVSMNIEDLPSFFSERGEDCLFVDGSLDSEYLQKIAIDEGYLRSFLFQSESKDLGTRILQYRKALKKMPAGLSSIVEKTVENGGLRNFLLLALRESEFLDPWEDYVLSALKRNERRERGNPRINLQKTVKLVFSEGGLLQDSMKGYEFRQEQFMTALEIAESIERDGNLMIEVGTGTGKSIAYLAPIAYACISTMNQAVVSTRTRILQDQLFKKDVEVLRTFPNLDDLRVSVMKGRERYLCVRKLFEVVTLALNKMLDEEMSKELSGILIWSMITCEGDLDTLPLKEEMRRMISGNRFDCTRRLCPFFEICPYYVQRENAKCSDIVITNHSFLFSEANIRLSDGDAEEREDIGTLLPGFKYLVVDEAHELEASLTQAMSYRFQPYELAGTVRRLIKAVRNSFGFLKRHFDEDFLRRLWTKLKEATASLDKQITELVRVTGSSESGNRTTFTGRELEVIISMLVAISDTLQTHVYIGTQTMQMLDDVEERNEKIDGLEAEVSRILTETREWMKQIAGITSSQESRVVYVSRFERRLDSLSIISSPVENDTLMASIFPDVSVKIFISATLWVYSRGSDGFNYARRILGTSSNNEAVRLGTSFDYTQQLKFFVPTDLPDYLPNSLIYLESAADITLKALKIVGGGSMVLFTSYEDMKGTLSRISGGLGDMVIHIQDREDSPTTILADHVNSEKSVIFGARAFWEGVDLPGEQLKLLIVYKLPFERPDEPLIEARIRHYGKRSFVEGMNKYYYPKMITAFRQGLGRLIRTRGDHGVVIVLDKRIIDSRRAYSRKLQASLPPGVDIQAESSSKILRELRKLKRERWI